jgi:hypothetical protein
MIKQYPHLPYWIQKKKTLIFNDRTGHYNRVNEFSHSQRNRSIDGSYKFIRTIQYVAEDVLKKWINSACNDVLKNKVLADKLIGFFGTLSSFSHVAQNIFMNLYKNL